MFQKMNVTGFGMNKVGWYKGYETGITLNLSKMNGQTFKKTVLFHDEKHIYITGYCHTSPFLHTVGGRPEDSKSIHIYASVYK